MVFLILKNQLGKLDFSLDIFTSSSMEDLELKKVE